MSTSMQGITGDAHDTGEPQIVRVPGWERFPWLRAGFSTRHAGLSEAYGVGELNLGWTKDDKEQTVARNREAFARAVAAGATLPLVTVGQVHGAAVRNLDEESGPLMTPAGRAALEGDGLVSAAPGRLLAILTADCTPLLVADTRTHAVAAFHAGWRGTVARIAEHGIRMMQDLYGSRVEDLVAAIGPCIGPCCFEVGPEVRAAFLREFPYGEALIRTTDPQTGKSHVDLVEANRRQLLQAGIPEAQIAEVSECTACATDGQGRRRYYSYRAEAARCGRMLSAIGAVS